MKKLGVSNITSSVGMPIKSGTLQFLQDSYTEVLNALVTGYMGSNYDNSKAYIIYGVNITSGGSGYDFTAGAVYYQGEVFLVDAQHVGVLSIGQVLISNITTTQYTTNADPVTFTDSNTYNVHNVRKITFAKGSTGTGSAPDWLSYLQLPVRGFAQISDTASGGNYNVVVDRSKYIQLSGVLGAGASTVTIPYSTTMPIGAEIYINCGNLTGGDSITLVNNTSGHGILVSNATITGAATAVWIKIRVVANDTVIAEIMKGI